MHFIGDVGVVRQRIHMCQRAVLFAILTASCVVPSCSAQTAELSPTVQTYVRVKPGKVILTHVRVIDGTGAPAEEDRNLTIENGKITAIQGADVPVAASASLTILDLRGYTVMPGIVGMHNHLFYIAQPNLTANKKSEEPLLTPQMTFSSPRLYLASGVTTMRTTGSIETYTDLNLRDAIDSGQLPGPHIDVTGPYLDGPSFFLQEHFLKNADEARQMVNFWADQGVNSFKAYMFITRDELKAAIDTAHKRGIKVTGHLCSVTYKEAAELGIDNLEHGFFANTQLDPEKKADVCPDTQGMPTILKMDPAGPEARDLFDTLIKHHVAITSTLPVFEAWAGPGRPPLRQGVLDAMTPEARTDYFILRQREPKAAKAKYDMAEVWKRDLELERAFVKAGGLLIAGPDPTGAGDVLPGFGDQREIELLVEAGFSPVEAIRIATYNGALYLGREKEIGSIATGKNADLVVIKGDPSKNISDIENIELVFKDGVGFDSHKLLESVRARYGQY